MTRTSCPERMNCLASWVTWLWVPPVPTATPPLQEAATRVVGGVAGELRVGAADRLQEVGVAAADLRQVVALPVEGGGPPEPQPRSGGLVGRFHSVQVDAVSG